MGYRIHYDGLEKENTGNADSIIYTKYVDHLHEHFKWPCTINENGRYNTPNIPKEWYRYGYALSSPIFTPTVSALFSIEMKPESIAECEFPARSYLQDCLNEKLTLIRKISGELGIYIYLVTFCMVRLR